MKDLDRREGHVHVGRQLLAARLLPRRRLGHRARSCARAGVVILGKLGLSEYANSFGSQPSGLRQPHRAGAQRAGRRRRTPAARRRAPARRAPPRCRRWRSAPRPRARSSARRSRAGHRRRSGRRSASSRATASAPIAASQDTAGPMDRTVADAAMTLQSIAGRDPDTTPGTHARSSARTSTPSTSRRPLRRRLPELHVGARPELRPRQADRLQRHAHRRHAAARSPTTRSSPPGRSWCRGRSIAGRPLPALPGGYEQHKTIDRVLREPRPGRADQEPRGGGRRQPAPTRSRR